MAKSIAAQAKTKQGELSVQQHETDCPIVPIEHLERLHQFRPDLVDWIVKETSLESQYRRKRVKVTNLYVFIERISGQIFALLIGLCGILGGSYVALNGQPWAGASIASVTIGTLAVAFLATRNPKQ